MAPINPAQPPNQNNWVFNGFVVPVNATISGTATNLQYGQLVATEPVDLCVEGHVVAEDHIEYFDGLVVSNCSGCGARILLARVPGGISVLKLKAFLGTVMGMELGGEDDNFRLADLLGLLRELRDEVDREAEALRRANSMINLAAVMLEDRIEKSNVEF